MFRDLERVQTVFTAIAAHRDFAVNLGYRGETARSQGLFVSGSYFSVLGLQPAAGRLLGPDDDRHVGGSDAVVLSHAFWESQFGRRLEALGETMVVNGHPHDHRRRRTTRLRRHDARVDATRVRPDHHALAPAALVREPARQSARILDLSVCAPRPGVTSDQAQAAVDTPYRALINDVEAPLQEGLSAETMAEFRARRLLLEPGSHGQSRAFGEARAPLTLLVGVTTLVLIVACVNVGNLLLARAAARSKEIATRLSIGATRDVSPHNSLTESTVLAFIAALVSLLVARWTMGLFRALVATGERDFPFYFDSSALAATAALTLTTSIALGLLSTLQALRPGVLLRSRHSPPCPPAGRPRGSGSRSPRHKSRCRWCSWSWRASSRRVWRTSATSILASTTEGLVQFGISPDRNGYTAPRAALLFQQLEDDIAALPGVTAVTSSKTWLLSGEQRADSVFVEGFSVEPDTDNDSRYDEVGAGYFQTLGVPLISGREFMRADFGTATRAAIVNEQFAQKFGLGRQAVGKRMSRGDPSLDLEIVGLVKDFKHANLSDAPAPMFFLPHRESRNRPGFMAFYVRTSRNPSEMMPAIRRVVSRHDANLPIERLRTMAEQVRSGSVVYRLMGVLVGSFAALATLVAGIGLYGVLAYAVAQRTPEIGLRMALGATRFGVRWMVLRQVGLITLVGGTLGLATAILTGRAAQSLLFGLQFHDPIVLAASIGVLALVALAAGLVPANRAASVDPMRALKYE